MKSDGRYNLLLLIDQDDYEAAIEGNPELEQNWMKVLDQASNTTYWMLKTGKPYVDMDGERLPEDLLAEANGIDLETTTPYECTFSAKYVKGFDYYPLWEMCMADGSIDGEEVDCDALAQMIKSEKYFTGEKGGYTPV